MQQLLALFFILIAAGIPSVAAYFSQQTYAVISVIESAGAQVAAVFDSQKADSSIEAPATSVAPDPYEYDITGGDWKTPVMQEQSAVPELI